MEVDFVITYRTYIVLMMHSTCENFSLIYFTVLLLINLITYCSSKSYYSSILVKLPKTANSQCTSM